MNPDCRDGKHASCSGDGWDTKADTPAPCPCDCHTDPCCCWTGPARHHAGHCCMREPLPAVCHLEEGRAAYAGVACA